MPVIQAQLTDDGKSLQAIAASNNTPFQIDTVKLGTGKYTPTGTETDINTPFSPVKEFTVPSPRASGSVFQFTFVDDSDDAYTAYEIGWFSGGTLVALYSHPTNSGLLKIASLPTYYPIIVEIESLSFANVTLDAVTWPFASESLYGTTKFANGNEIEGVSDSLAISPKRFNGQKASATEAQAGTNDTKWVSPKGVAEVLTGTGLFATQAEAQAGTSLTKYMNPLRTFQSVMSWFSANRATQTEAENGLNNSKLMTPLRVFQAVTGRIASNVQAIAGTDNTKMMTPLRTRSAIVNDRRAIATQLQAEAGTSNVEVMTPLRTKQALSDYVTNNNIQTIHISTSEPTDSEWGDGDIWFVREA